MYVQVHVPHQTELKTKISFTKKEEERIIFDRKFVNPLTYLLQKLAIYNKLKRYRDDEYYLLGYTAV
jgi:hypothetical protein